MTSYRGTFFTPLFKKRFKDLIKISLGGTFTFYGIGIYSNDEKFYKSFVMPIFHSVDPERAHKLGIFVAKHWLIPHTNPSTELLESCVLGVKCPNPIGVAAGYDKNGEAVEGLFRMGFGFVEVGTVTPKPQAGNPKPRVFRIPELNGIINRYGFNSDGYDAVYERLSRLDPPGQRRGAVGVNLGMNKGSLDSVNDYVVGVRKFGPLADYLVINVSSPNTPGLRKMQQKEELESLTSAVIKERNSLSRKPPIFLKISPDLSAEEKKDIIAVISKEKNKVDGLIISNTTTSRPEDVDCQHINETGGLSGRPLKTMASSTLREIAELTKGEVPLIGVGGIESVEDVKERIYNGASLVQIYSSLTYVGPPLIKRLVTDLEDHLRKDGYTCVSEAVGSKLKIKY